MRRIIVPQYFSDCISLDAVQGATTIFFKKDGKLLGCIRKEHTNQYVATTGVAGQVGPSQDNRDAVAKYLVQNGYELFAE